MSDKEPTYRNFDHERADSIRDQQWNKDDDAERLRKSKAQSCAVHSTQLPEEPASDAAALLQKKIKDLEFRLDSEKKGSTVLGQLLNAGRNANKMLRREVEELRAENARLTKYGDGLKLAVEGYDESLAAVTKERDEARAELAQITPLKNSDIRLVIKLTTERDAALASAEAGAKDTALMDWLEANYDQIERMGGKWWSVNIGEWSPTLRAAIVAATEGESQV